jgi:cysteine desulfurase/selenocysteine lyase
MDFAEARRLYPATVERTHLNAAGLGLCSSRTIKALQQFLDLMAVDPTAAYRSGADVRARAAAAALVGATPEQIALSPATSLGLNIAADAVPLAHGQNVVTTNLEFMSVVVPWLEKCRSAGAELRIARHDRGRIPADAVTTLIDDATAAVVVSTVQWTNGYRMDLKRIGEACRRRGVPFIVDAIQQLGVVPLDVADSHIDFLACGGHKWLGSPTALGFTFASDEFATRFRPSLSYAPTSVPPGDGWLKSWLEPDYDPVQTYALQPHAARFEMGVHHAAMSAAGLAAAIGLFNEIGVARIAAHALRLGERVAAGLRTLDLEIVTPLEREHRSGIMTFHAGRTPADDAALQDHLLAQEIEVAVRFTSGVGGVRVSTHLYSNEEDVDRLLQAVGEWLRR